MDTSPNPTHISKPLNDEEEPRGGLSALPLLKSQKAASIALGVSFSVLRDGVVLGEIPTVLVGSRRLIHIDTIYALAKTGWKTKARNSPPGARRKSRDYSIDPQKEEQGVTPT